jgi:hypothetical protein
VAGRGRETPLQSYHARANDELVAEIAALGQGAHPTGAISGILQNRLPLGSVDIWTISIFTG